ncbi:MAG: ligase-associated DNA damage response endonuclease PdeM [Phycisphaeraceae bacterium]
MDERATVEMTWAGQDFVLLPEGGLYWRQTVSVVIADPHFGKADHFRRAGVPVPGDVTAANLRRLDAMIGRTGARRLVMLGDVLHAREGASETMLTQLARWRDAHAGLAIEAVRGNHDWHAGPMPASLGIVDRGDAWVEGGIVLRHEPMADERGRPVMAGHVHPAVWLHGVAMRSTRLACFHFAERLAVLPAFGAFTGMHPVRPRCGDRVFALGPEGVFEVGTGAR